MPGRNDPCPCGRGKKFKKCCGDPRRAPRVLPPQVLAAVAEHERREREHRERFGHVRQVVHTDFAGHKIVAVGNRIHWSKKWRTFPDFLLDYLRGKIPEGWYQAEMEKVLEERHPLAQWYWRYCEFQARNWEPDANGLFGGEPDGPSLSLLVLAHELYIIDDNMLLQELLLRRLLHPDHFQSARYELTVAAATVRAGYDLTMEDEDDPTSTHPEFVATHKASGIRVAVEAKSRRRGGVLGHPGEPKETTNLAQDVRRLFRDALRKAGDLPLFVFIDANLPPEIALALAPEWEEQFQRMVVEEARPIDENGVVVGHPHNLLLVTNVGYHYGEPVAPLPGQLCYSHWPDPRGCRRPVPPQLIRDVEESMARYGRIPTDFE